MLINKDLNKRIILKMLKSFFITSLAFLMGTQMGSCMEIRRLFSLNRTHFCTKHITKRYYSSQNPLDKTCKAEETCRSTTNLLPKEDPTHLIPQGNEEYKDIPFFEKLSAEEREAIKKRKVTVIRRSAKEREYLEKIDVMNHEKVREELRTPRSDYDN